MISNSILSYIKTTETCNLNCKHCFTNGSSGKKIFFNPERTTDFFHRLKRDFPNINTCRFVFHGGEPMLAPPSDILKFIDLSKGIFEYTDYSIQTNFVYKVNEDRAKVLDNFENIGTSWDYDIRFDSIGNKEKNIEIWESNVKRCIENGKNLTLMVSITDKLVKEKTPLEIINYAISLGIQNILFERITENGNFLLNKNIRPSNVSQGKWILLMWEQTLKYKLYEKINNMLLDEIARAFIYNEHTANRCRDCEQSLFTISADGTISGCPNTADTNKWGSINDRVVELIKSPNRMKDIICELTKNQNCVSCPVNSYCNGDCHNLPWDGNICGAPKELFIRLSKEKNIELYKKLLI